MQWPWCIMAHCETLRLVAESRVWTHLHLDRRHELQIPDHAALRMQGGVVRVKPGQARRWRRGGREPLRVQEDLRKRKHCRQVDACCTLCGQGSSCHEVHAKPQSKPCTPQGLLPCQHLGVLLPLCELDRGVTARLMEVLEVAGVVSQELCPEHLRRAGHSILLHRGRSWGKRYLRRVQDLRSPSPTPSFPPCTKPTFPLPGSPGMAWHRLARSGRPHQPWQRPGSPPVEERRDDVVRSYRRNSRQLAFTRETSTHQGLCPPWDPRPRQQRTRHRCSPRSRCLNRHCCPP